MICLTLGLDAKLLLFSVRLQYQKYLTKAVAFNIHIKQMRLKELHVMVA